MTKIAMWSGPRNISTTLMRAFGSRPDTFVSDEPFYAHYLYKTGKKHPLRENIIRNDLMKYLSLYMIPKKIHILKKLPKNSNGKLDRLEIKKKYIY